MLEGALIGSLLITLIISPSNAAEAEHVAVLEKQPCSPDSPCKLVATPRQKCYKALAAVESQLYERVKAKTLDEEKIDELNLLLDEADHYCKKGNYKKSKPKMEAVIGILRGLSTEKVD